jgi:hypothetical protein
VPIEDVDTPYSDGWWLRRLLKALNATPPALSESVRDSRKTHMGRRDWFDLLWSYNIGEAPLPRVSRQHKEATREFLRLARANYGMLAVEALLDRVTLAGVDTAGAVDTAGDELARAIHAANGAWLQDTLGFTFALGQGFAFVGPGDEPGQAVITAEDPRQVIAAMDPVRPLVARAALKTYRDDDAGEDVAHLFLPAAGGRGDRVRVAVRIGSIGLNPSRFVSSAWEWDDARSGDLQVQGFGVPVVPFVNRLGLGEYEPHLDLLDRINNMIGDRLWVSKFQVFRQRALRIKEGGQPLPDVDPDTGEKIDYDDLFEADPGAMWELPAGVDIWESQQTDMTPILTSVRDDVREFSAVTRTPLSMFSPQGADTSAAGAENLSDGLVFKGEDRTARLTPSVARTMQLALAYAGEVELARRPLGVTWAPVRRTTLTERAQAATAGKASGVPQEAIYSELWQFTPEQVARMQRQRGSDLFFQAQTPAPTTNGPVVAAPATNGNAPAANGAGGA